MTVANPTGCCEELGYESVQSETDLSGGGCQIQGVSTTTTYPYCPGSPTVTSPPDGESTCPDLKVALTINPPVLNLSVGDIGNFSATGTGTRAGQTVFKNAPASALWWSDDDAVAGFIDGKGAVEARQYAPTPVTVHARLIGLETVEATARVLINESSTDATVGDGTAVGGGY